jgi:hypothetical protein
LKIGKKTKEAKNTATEVKNFFKTASRGLSKLTKRNGEK